MSLAELEETAYDNYLLNLENFHVKMFCNKVSYLTCSETCLSLRACQCSTDPTHPASIRTLCADSALYLKAVT